MSDGETTLSDEEWRRRLTPARFEVLRRSATEPPFSGELLHVDGDGTFRCAGCGTPLFSSETQFDSGSGWPSFYAPLDPDRVALHEDLSHNMVRVEVTCRVCGGHLGHLFDDGPDPTGQRWCINSTSLDLDPSA